MIITDKDLSVEAIETSLEHQEKKPPIEKFIELHQIEFIRSERCIQKKSFSKENINQDGMFSESFGSFRRSMSFGYAFNLVNLTMHIALMFILVNMIIIQKSFEHKLVQQFQNIEQQLLISSTSV